jgi:hypothetical protein
MVEATKPMVNRRRSVAIAASIIVRMSSTHRRRFTMGFVASTIYARLPALIREFRAEMPDVEPGSARAVGSSGRSGSRRPPPPVAGSTG